MDGITRLLVDQHFREYDSRLQHLDKLLEQAQKKAVAQSPEQAETSAQLEELKLERDKLAVWLDELKLKSLENWREDEIMKAGPMGIWDAVAQQVEKMVEHIER